MRDTMQNSPTSPPRNRNAARRYRWLGFIFCLATLAFHGEVPAGSPLRHAPTIVEAKVVPLPRPTYLATPEVRTLLGYTRRVLHLHDGHTLGVFSFSDNGLGNWLFLIDGRDLSVQRYDMPNHDAGAHGSAIGSDGNIYCMPYGTGRAYKFDTAKRRFSTLPNLGLPPGELTWGAIGDSHSPAIYFGTYPNACLVRYDIATGNAEIRPHIVPDATYVMDFSEDDAGIHCRATGPGNHWLTIRGRDFSVVPSSQPMPPPPFTPPPAAAPDTAIQYPTKIGERRFGIGWPSGRLLEFTSAGRTIERGNTGMPAEPWFIETVGDDTLVGISHYGAAFRFDLKTNRFDHRDLQNLARGSNGIMFLESITPHCVLGANYSQQNLFRCDPQSGKLQMLNSMISRFPGESICAIGFGGKAYIGSYIHAVILKYDPDQVVKFGQNPRELISLFDRFDQTRPQDAATDGRHIFFTSDADYSKLGGALAEVDPATGHVDGYSQPVKDQNLPSVVFDPKTRRLWLSTDRWGEQHSVPPRSSTAVIAAWDPSQHRVVKTITPWPQTDVIRLVGCTADGVLIATSGGELALIDTESVAVLWRGASPIGQISKVRRGADGAYYCLGSGVMYRWRMPENSLQPIAATDGCAFLSEYAPGQWALANSAAVYRLRR